MLEHYQSVRDQEGNVARQLEGARVPQTVSRALVPSARQTLLAVIYCQPQLRAGLKQPPLHPGETGLQDRLAWS